MSTQIQANAQQVLQQINTAVETDQIKLPTLPEVALKIRTAVEKGDHSAVEIAELLAQDTALSVRLLQLANSPLYRARSEIDSLQMAITRLGVRIVKELVIMLAIKQAFTTPNKALSKQFKEVWQTSVDVAATCRVLARAQPELDVEHAVLAGLIHNIGALPIIELASHEPALLPDIQALKEITNEIQSPVGDKILSFWNFPKSLIDVASQWHDFSREHESDIDYVDLVQAAILHTQHAPDYAPKNWSNIPAIHKLGLDPTIRTFDETMQSQLDETRESLMQI
jgi:HD-like signal output (HDOD) protein